MLFSYDTFCNSSVSLKSIFLSLFWLTSTTAQESYAQLPSSKATPLKVSVHHKKQNLLEHSVIYEDTTKKLAAESVAQAFTQNKFENLKEPFVSLGFSDSLYWLRFEIENQYSETLERIIEYSTYTHHDLTLYQVDDEAGFIKIPFGRDNHQHFLNRTLSIPANSVTTFYLQFSSPNNALIFNLYLYERDQFFLKSRLTNYVFGIFYGILLLTILYNFFVYLPTRDKAYLYYVQFVASLAFFFFVLNGLVYEVFGTEIYVQRLLPFSIAIVGMTFVVFSREFLKTRTLDPKLDKFFVGIFYGALIFTSVNFFLPFLVTVVNSFLISGAAIFTSILASARIYKKGYVPARYYLGSFIPLCAGVFMNNLCLLGIYNTTFGMLYSSQVGYGVGVVVLALALSDRINTMREEKEKAQKESIDSLKRADKLKDEFLANTSHELRTPLNGIIGLTESMFEKSQGEDKKKLGLVISSGRRLSSLINDILDLSKLKHKNLQLNLKPLSLRELTDMVLDLSRVNVGQREIKLVNQVNQDLPLILADEDRIIQILHNLVGNAIKFTERGQVGVEAVENGDKIQITVFDTGIGIADENSENIFRSFEQVEGGFDRRFSGTGLGLTVTKQLVELHKGEIWVESALGLGSKFYFTVYKADASDGVKMSIEQRKPALTKTLLHENESTELEYQPTTEVSKSGFRVLAVDDEPINLQVIKEQLTTLGHEVICSENGFDALSFLSKGDPYDLVILDVMMPRLTGLDVCRKIRKNFSASELPVIFLTARTQISTLIDGFDAGGNDFLVKPFSAKELSSRVQSHITIKNLSKEVANRRAEKAVLEKDLEAAKAVQEALLPHGKEVVPGINIATHYQSADQTGGDWYTYQYDQAKNRLFLFVGDVTGHGIPSALITGVACGAIKSFLASAVLNDETGPSQLLMKMAEIASKIIGQVGERSHRSMTMAFVSIDLDDGIVTYLNAGHPTMVHISSESAKRIIAIGPFLGSDDHGFSTKTIKLTPGDKILIYSDGLTENLGPDGRKLKPNRLMKTLKTAKGNAEDIKKIIMEQANEIWQSHPADDDCTVLVVEWEGSPSSSFSKAI